MSVPWRSEVAGSSLAVRETAPVGTNGHLYLQYHIAFRVCTRVTWYPQVESRRGQADQRHHVHIHECGKAQGVLAGKKAKSFETENRRKREESHLDQIALESRGHTNR